MGANDRANHSESEHCIICIQAMHAATPVKKLEAKPGEGREHEESKLEQ